MRPSIAVEESVIQLGSNLRSARLRRRMPQSVIADRAGHITQYAFQNWKWRLRCLYWKHCLCAQRAWLVPSSVRPGCSARRLCRINAGRKESASASAFKKEICRTVIWTSRASHSIDLSWRAFISLLMNVISIQRDWPFIKQPYSPFKSSLAQLI